MIVMKDWYFQRTLERWWPYVVVQWTVELSQQIQRLSECHTVGLFTLMKGNFSVAKATLESQMSVRLSVCLFIRLFDIKTPLPLKIADLLCLLTIVPINNRAYWPSGLLSRLLSLLACLWRGSCYSSQSAIRNISVQSSLFLVNHRDVISVEFPN